MNSLPLVGVENPNGPTPFESSSNDRSRKEPIDTKLSKLCANTPQCRWETKPDLVRKFSGLHQGYCGLNLLEKTL